MDAKSPSPGGTGFFRFRHRPFLFPIPASPLSAICRGILPPGLKRGTAKGGKRGGGNNVRDVFRSLAAIRESDLVRRRIRRLPQGMKKGRTSSSLFCHIVRRVP